VTRPGPTPHPTYFYEQRLRVLFSSEIPLLPSLQLQNNFTSTTNLFQSVPCPQMQTPLLPFPSYFISQAASASTFCLEQPQWNFLPGFRVSVPAAGHLPPFSYPRRLLLSSEYDNAIAKAWAPTLLSVNYATHLASELGGLITKIFYPVSLLPPPQPFHALLKSHVQSFSFFLSVLMKMYGKVFPRWICSSRRISGT